MSWLQNSDREMPQRGRTHVPISLTPQQSALRGKFRPGPQAELPHMHRGPGRQAKACQHRRRRRLAGAHRRRHTKQERCDKVQTLQLHVPRGYMAQGSCRVKQERDNESRGSNNGDTTGRKHRLRVVRPRTHPEEVIPEKGKCHGAVQARDTLAFKQQMLNVAPSVFSVFSVRLSPLQHTLTQSSNNSVKGRSHTVEKRISTHSHNMQAPSHHCFRSRTSSPNTSHSQCQISMHIKTLTSALQNQHRKAWHRSYNCIRLRRGVGVSKKVWV